MKGGFAKCYEVTEVEHQKKFAAKVFTKNSLKKDREQQKLYSEIEIHQSLRHENIVKFHHYFEDREYVYVLLELCSNISLGDLVKKRRGIQEIEARCFML